MVLSFSKARAAVRSHARASSRVLRAAATAATRASYSRHGSHGGLSRGRGVLLLPLGDDGSDDLLLIDGEVEVLLGMVDKTVKVRGGGGRRR
jgi:hypothetical protein